MPSTDQALIKQYKKLHQQPYGRSSIKQIGRFLPHIRELNPNSILDFGCGHSRLIDYLNFKPDMELFRYDPAVPDICVKPDRRFDLVINTDVLEHVPEHDIDAVLAEIAKTGENAIFSIDMAPAKHLLPNGENPHITLKPANWWAQKLNAHFDLIVPMRASRPTKCAFKTWSSEPSRGPARMIEFIWITVQRKLLKKYQP